DEGLSIAQSVDEVYIESDHLLAAMTERQLGTAMLLEQYGITKSAMVEMMGMRHDKTRVPTMKRPTFEEPSRPSNTTQDFVAEAKTGSLRAVYFREALLRDVMHMVTQARNRHVILVGPDGVGKRTLGYSFA